MNLGSRPFVFKWNGHLLSRFEFTCWLRLVSTQTNQCCLLLLALTSHLLMEFWMMGRKTRGLPTENAMPCACKPRVGIFASCSNGFTIYWIYWILKRSLTFSSGCKAWTRIKRSVSGGSQEGECWLRDHQPKAKLCNSCDSGTLDYTVYTQKEYRSKDIIGYNKPAYTKVYSNKLCASLCYADSGLSLGVASVRIVAAYIQTAVTRNFIKCLRLTENGCWDLCLFLSILPSADCTCRNAPSHFFLAIERLQG